MKVACCIRSNATCRAIEGSLQRHRLHPARFGAALPPLRSLNRHDIALVIVEMGASRAGDEVFFRWLRRRPAGAPPVLLVGGAVCRQRVARAFDSGIDDYCALPLDEVEFDARLRALLRRRAPPPPQRALAFHGFMLDRELRTLHDRGLPIALTAREFLMAWLFFSTPGVPVAWATISSALRQTGAAIDSRAIEQHLHKLRAKLGLGPSRGVRLRSAGSAGYRLEATMAGAAGV